MLSDPFINFTKAIGAEVDKSGRGLGIRSNRYTMLVDNLKVLNITLIKYVLIIVVLLYFY